MKKLIALLLALVMLFACVMTLVACKDDEDENGDSQNGGETNGSQNGDSTGENNDQTSGGNTGSTDNTPVKYDYTVKVVDGNGNAVVGAIINLEVLTVGKFEITTASNGVATYNMTESKLPVYASIKSLPEGYGKGDEDEATIAPGSKSAIIEVVKQVKYSAVLTDASGNAVSGVNVQICVGDSCLTGKDTNADGEVYFYINPTTEAVKLQINGLTDTKPEGFELDSNTGSYYKYFEASEFSMNVTIKEA